MTKNGQGLSPGPNRGIQPCSQLGREKADPVYHVRCCQLQGYLRPYTWSERYRFTLANLHRLQYGRGAVVTYQPSPRIRVDRQQLDHFLSFVTSPHLVQDLPFGQKTLKLSSGKLIEIPNVIRTMIPQKVARQYSHYSEETNFKPFSERTMLRVLAECKAFVWKSLQGLDYFAADGARVFKDLDNLVRQLGDLGLGNEWQVQHVELLKAAKSYIKGDFKVTLFVTETLALRRDVKLNLIPV